MSESFADYQVSKINPAAETIKVKITDSDDHQTFWINVTQDQFDRIAKIIRED